MPGRQAHGRPLTAAAPTRNNTSNKKSKARSRKNALDAFGIAQEQFPTQSKRTPRFRELDADIDRKHGRDDDADEDDNDNEDEEEEPRRKKMKGSGKAPASNENAEFGSDSEGNEWQLGGMAEDDEDSEIESDDAFGESDEEKFQDFTFRGTKSKQAAESDSEDDENDDEGETLGEDAIDLATALDQYESDDDEIDASGPAGSESEEEEDDEDSDSVSESQSGEDSNDDDDDDEFETTDQDKMEKLRGLISGYGGEEDGADQKTASRPKIGLSDLGLSGISDPFMSKSVKLMKKEDKEKRPGTSKKLDVPLTRREQGRMDRSVAYEKTNETLNRWTDTVKQNRRAEHLVFPLPQNSATAGLDNTEIQPLTAKKSSNELESAIMSIMEESGLSMDKPSKPKEPVYDEEGNELTRKEIQNRKRMERELRSREAKRAKRINKIKSKAYHRVHRKQRERDEMAAKEAMEEAGEIDSEEEREAQDRRRALERVGQRHKESKWAKLGSRAKRAVWDEDYRAGLVEMARKDEELRRRKEGKAVDSDDETSSSGSDDDDDEDASLRRDLDKLEEEEDEPQSKLMSMKFMQKAEAAKRQANDDMIKQIRRELDGEEFDGFDDAEVEEVGRRQFGAPNGKAAPALGEPSPKSRKGPLSSGGPAQVSKSTRTDVLKESESAPAPFESTASSTAGAWSRGEARSKKKGTSGVKLDDLDLNANILVASKPKAKKNTTANNTRSNGAQNDDDSASDTDQHLPLAIRDQEMVARAFAGEDVVGEFEREKHEVADEDDDKVVDNTLPGWGSWVGEGVSNKEKKRHQGRFMTKVEGVKKKQDRRDAKLDKVIVSEKRIKKNDRYLASQLPHPFESRQQYERSLRLPVGPEWMTKETFQDSTKPRVLMKQGVITAMSKPTA